MAVKKFMNTFFQGLQEQATSGYGSKIVSTPIGPFTWNSELNVWVNLNNGMVMNNISFQESIAMMDYDTGGSDGTVGTVYGTIPMDFTPTIYNITSNYGEGSSVTITPSILVPSGTSNFKIKWISDGGYGGTLSTLSFTRNRSGVNLIVDPFNENTNVPGGPANISSGDILTFSAKASNVYVIGNEQYSLYFYNNSGVTLSSPITINVAVPPVIEPLLINTTTRTFTNIEYSGVTYIATNNSAGNSPESLVPGLQFSFLNNNAPVNYKLYFTDVVGATFANFSIDADNNSDPKTTVSVSENQGFTIDAGNAFLVGAYMQPAGGSSLTGSGNIVLYNNTAGEILTTMPYSFDLPPSNTTITPSGNFGGLTVTAAGGYYTNTLGGSTSAINGNYVTYSGSATQAVMVGVSFTNQQGPIQLNVSNISLFPYETTYVWGDTALVYFDDADNRVPFFPGLRATIRVENTSTGTGSGNILLYDFTNNTTLATIPYSYNIP